MSFILSFDYDELKELFFKQERSERDPEEKQGYNKTGRGTKKIAATTAKFSATVAVR
jgi:hypothetical protein